MYLLNHQCVSGTGSLTCACRLYAARRAFLIGAGMNFRLLENVCHSPKIRHKTETGHAAANF